MVLFLSQFGVAKNQAFHGNLLGPLLLIVAGAVAGAVLIPGLGFTVGRTRGVLARRRARRRALRRAAGAETRARAMMSELCPQGWRAQITLYEGADEQDNGQPVRGPVALDWCELTAGGRQPVVVRRVWAESVAEALEAMVSDRRTDETLEQIELRASADGALWPDL